MGSEIQLGVMRAQKREIQLVQNFIFSVKKYAFKSFYMELGSFFCNYSANLIENML
jgi:hypothetical protein